jgi:hypothetical protein
VIPRSRRSKTRIATGSAALAALALAALLALLALAGCAPSVPSTAAAAADPKTQVGHIPGYAQTLAQAEDTYHQYVSTSAAAAASGNRAQALNLVADAQWAQVKAQYEALASTGTPIPQYSYGPAHFYVPAPEGYPRWFMVTVPRSLKASGQQDPAAPVVNTIMVFEQARAKALWTLDGTAALGGTLPALARQSDGYVVNEPETDAGVLVRPDLVGPSQASVADEGPSTPAAAVVSPGAQTTGLYTVQSAQFQAEKARGLAYLWLLEGAPFAQFQLRLAAGGDLVLYGMYLNTSDAHPGLFKGSPIPVPAGFTPLLAAPTEVGYHAVYANWTYQFAAIDPPATSSHAKISIIATGSARSYGHAY